jgi:hypothetical protein
VVYTLCPAAAPSLCTSTQLGILITQFPVVVITVVVITAYLVVVVVVIVVIIVG